MKLFLSNLGGAPLQRVCTTAFIIFALISWYTLARQYFRCKATIASFSTFNSSAPVNFPSQNLTALDSPFAYVFYATDDLYACSALVNIHRLRQHSKYPSILLASPTVSNATLDRFEAAGVYVVHDQAPPLHAQIESIYYEQVLLKLRAFRLHEVLPNLKRIVVMDSDQLVNQNLDGLFALPETDIAAPRNYWTGKGEGITTTLMVASLSERLWSEMEKALQDIRPTEFDMDLVNRYFGRTATVLPGRFCTLNSHWEANDLPAWYKGLNGLDGLWDEVAVLHYTAYEKPWNVLLENVGEKGTEHPAFKEQFRLWQDEANTACGWEQINVEMNV